MSNMLPARYHAFEYRNEDFKRPLGRMTDVVDKSREANDTLNDKDNIPTNRGIVTDFFESTSIHGLQYFGKTDVKVGVFGKILWVCTMVLGFACLTMMVSQFLSRYYENPTTTYIESFHTPIFTAPFPAVTVCPFSPIPEERLIKIMDGILIPENMTKKTILTLLKYGHFITLPYAVQKYGEIKDLKKLLDANRWSVSDFLKILKPCEDVILSCWWDSERIDCSKSFTISHTSYGLCCSFNYLLEDYVGRDKKQPGPVPLQSFNYGRRSGLKLLVNTNNNDHKLLSLNQSISSNEGAWVFIHHSLDFPGLNVNTYTLQQNRELQIGITPEINKKSVDLFHRNKKNEFIPLCISENTNTLEYFPIYRYLNCYAECRIKTMIEICGCVPFIYDHLVSHHDKLRPCEIDGLICIQDNSKKISIIKDVDMPNMTCSCRTPCEDVIYEGFPNSVPLIKPELAISYKNMTDNDSILRVFMQTQVFPTTETLAAADEVYLLGREPSKNHNATRVCQSSASFPRSSLDRRDLQPVPRLQLPQPGGDPLFHQPVLSRRLFPPEARTRQGRTGASEPPRAQERPTERLLNRWRINTETRSPPTADFPLPFFSNSRHASAIFPGTDNRIDPASGGRVRPIYCVTRSAHGEGRRESGAIRSISSDYWNAA